MPRALVVHVLLGGHGQLFGFTFLIFSLLLGTVFGAASEPIIGHSYDRRAPGVIVRVDDSGASTGNETIYAVDATFTDDRGAVRHVRSYTSPAPLVDTPVTVRYQYADPEHSVIDGMRTHHFSWWGVLIPLVFVGAGVWILGHGLPESRRALRLMRRGRVADATIVEVREESDGEGSVWIGTFEFTTVDRRTQRCEASTSHETRFVVGTREPVVYDPGWPDHATPFGHLPGSPAISADDVITYRAHPLRLVLVMVLAAATAITTIACAVITLRSWL